MEYITHFHKDFDEYSITLTRSSDAKEVRFTMRPYREGDEDGVLECVKSEYRNSYFKSDFYSVQNIKKKARSDHYVFFVVEAEGRIAAMHILTLFTPREFHIEPASQIILPKYRGFRLSSFLMEYVFSNAKALHPSCLFVHAVTFHNITQKICGYEQKMVPTGFRLGRFLTSKMSINFPLCRCPKYSEGIMILAVDKRDAGRVFLPEEIAGFGEKIYRRLGVSFEIEAVPSKNSSPEGAPSRKVPPDKNPAPALDKPDNKAIADGSVFDEERDDKQRFLFIRLIERGSDFKRKIASIIEGLSEPLWVIQVELSADSAAVADDYAALKSLGFFFSGLKPLCGEKEKFYMQWCSDMRLYTDEYVLTEPFQEIRRDLKLS